MSVDVIALSKYLVSTTPQKMIAKAVGNSFVEAQIVDLNTRGQLGKFEDSEETKLADIGGEYSLFTQFEKGLSPREVNLNDTGDYWNSFEVKPIKGGGYEITSDPFKEGENLKDRWGDKLEGLNKENEKKAERIVEVQVWKDAEKSL